MQKRHRKAAGLLPAAVEELKRIRAEWAALKHSDLLDESSKTNKRTHSQERRAKKRATPAQGHSEALCGVVALVEVGAEHRALPLRAALTALGASVVPNWTPLVTHVIWSEGGNRKTRKNARASAAIVVSPLWVEACAASNRRLPEKTFPAAPRPSDVPSPRTLINLLKKAEKNNVPLLKLLSNKMDRKPRKMKPTATITSRDVEAGDDNDSEYDSEDAELQKYVKRWRTSFVGTLTRSGSSDRSSYTSLVRSSEATPEDTRDIETVLRERLAGQKRLSEFDCDPSAPDENVRVNKRPRRALPKSVSNSGDFTDCGFMHREQLYSHLDLPVYNVEERPIMTQREMDAISRAERSARRLAISGRDIPDFGAMVDCSNTIEGPYSAMAGHSNVISGYPSATTGSAPARSNAFPESNAMPAWYHFDEETSDMVGPSYANPGRVMAGPSSANPGRVMAGPSSANPGRGMAGPSNANSGRGRAGPSNANSGRGMAGPSNANPGRGMAGPSSANLGRGTAGPSSANPGRGMAGPSSANLGSNMAGPSNANPGRGMAGQSSANLGSNMAGSSNANPGCDMAGPSDANPGTSSGPQTRRFVSISRGGPPRGHRHGRSRSTFRKITIKGPLAAPSQDTIPSIDGKIRIVLTGMARDERHRAFEAVHNLRNAKIQKNVNYKTTHVVVGNFGIPPPQEEPEETVTPPQPTLSGSGPRGRPLRSGDAGTLRTLSALAGAARGCRVVFSEWLFESDAANCWLSYRPYVVPDLKEISEKAYLERHAYDMMHTEYAYNIFYGRRVRMSTSVDNRVAAEHLLALCGAVVIDENGHIIHNHDLDEANRPAVVVEGVNGALLPNGAARMHVGRVGIVHHGVENPRIPHRNVAPRNRRPDRHARNLSCVEMINQFRNAARCEPVNLHLQLNSASNAERLVWRGHARTQFTEVVIGTKHGQVSSGWVFDSVTHARMHSVRKYMTVGVA